MSRLFLPPLLALLALGGSAWGQYDESDPRYEKDPREESDPRTEKDPRDVELEAERLAQLDPTDQLLETRQLFDLLYESQRDDDLATAMGDVPWDVLGTIDVCLQAWLRLIDRSTTATNPDAQAEVEHLAEKSRRFALLADRGIGDSDFFGWVSALQALTPEERALLHERKQLFDEALALLRLAESPDELLPALTPLERSLEQARALGDLHGEALARVTIGRVQAINAMHDAARATMTEAVRLGRLLRDLDTTWDGLSVIYEIAIVSSEFDAAREVLRDQYQISLEIGDMATSNTLIERLIHLDNFISGEPTTFWAGPQRSNPWSPARNPLTR